MVDSDLGSENAKNRRELYKIQFLRIFEANEMAPAENFEDFLHGQKLHPVPLLLLNFWMVSK